MLTSLMKPTIAYIEVVPDEKTEEKNLCADKQKQA